MSFFAKSAAIRRYNHRVIVLSLLYAVFLIGAVYGFKHHLLTGPLAWIAAVLPALAVSGIFVAIGRYFVEETDEYLRMLMVRQTLWATGITMSFCTIWGFLENFGLVDHIDAYLFAVVWFGGLGVGGCAEKLRAGNGE